MQPISRGAARDHIRAARDRAIRALYDAGLSSSQISTLRLADVRIFASGKVSLRLLRAGATPLYCVLDNQPANEVARHVAGRANADISQPVFAGRVAGAALTRQHVLRVLRAPQDPIERRQR